MTARAWLLISSIVIVGALLIALATGRLNFPPQDEMQAGNKYRIVIATPYEVMRSSDINRYFGDVYRETAMTPMIQDLTVRFSKSSRFTVVERHETELAFQRYISSVSKKAKERKPEPKPDPSENLVAEASIWSMLDPEFLKKFYSPAKDLRADYILIVHKESALSTRKHLNLPSAEGRVRVNTKAKVKYDYRLLDVRSNPAMEIVDTDSFFAEVSRRSGERDFGLEVAYEIDEGVEDEIGRQITLSVLDFISPAKVASLIEGEGQAIITRGALDGLFVGDRLTLYKEFGDEIRDASSRGISLGRAKRSVGVVRVVEVDDNLAFVSPDKESGFSGTMEIGDIVVYERQDSLSSTAASPSQRRLDNQARHEKDRQTSGGVPF